MVTITRDLEAKVMAQVFKIIEEERHYWCVKYDYVYAKLTDNSNPTPLALRISLNGEAVYKKGFLNTVTSRIINEVTRTDEKGGISHCISEVNYDMKYKKVHG